MSCTAHKLDPSNATPDQKCKILTYAAETRRFEIERFWQRSLFFWGFIAAALIAYGYLYDKQDNTAPLVLISCFGFVCSVAWTLQNRGGKYWQEAWEQKVESVEKDVLGVDLFSNPEPVLRKGPWGAARFSVSKLTIALSDFSVFIWIALGTHALIRGGLMPQPSMPVIAVLITIIYVGFLFVGGRSSCRS